MEKYTTINFLLIMTSLSFASYNVHGFNDDKIPIISSLVASHTFCLVQEHWLFNNQLDKLNSIDNICYHGVSGMCDNTMLSGRPHGGTAILWDNKFQGHVDPICFNSKRICGVVISMKDCVMLLCNVYMPVDTSHDRNNQLEYQSMLNEISSFAENTNIDKVLVSGDFNTDLSRERSLHTKSLIQFCDNEKYIDWLKLQPSIGNDFSFESKIDSARSLIDHFVLSQGLSTHYESAAILHEGLNMSDHEPISMTFNIPVSQVETIMHDVTCYAF